MRRAAAVAVVAAALTMPASRAGADELAYAESARVRTIAAALAAIRASSDEALADTYRYLLVVERSQCRAPLHSLEITCLLEAARRSCAQRQEGVRERCHRVSDVIASVRLGEKQLVPRQVRLAIMKEHTNYRPVLERELRRRHAALAIEMTMTTLPSPDAGEGELAAAIDGYCRDVAGTRELSWQHCAAALVWFIGTSEATPPGTSMSHPLFKVLAREADKLRQAGLYKTEGAGAEQDGGVDLTGHDYLGLGGDARVRDAAIAATRELGPGTASSRAFGGTREAHRRLEGAVAGLLEQPAAIVFSSGYAAAVGLFDPLLDSRDAILCDAWVHPSVADGARLSGARAIPYRQGDVEDLEDKLKRSRAARFRAIVTGGVFPFSGELAALGDICDLADRYEAIVVLDDRLGTGVLGERGRGSAERARVSRRVHLTLGSFSDALGGGGGGFIAGAREVIDWLRQKSAPYLFSGSLAPPLVGAASAAIDLVARGETPLSSLRARAEALRSGLLDQGFAVLGGHHPILTVAVGDTVTLQKMVNRLFGFRIRVNGLCYPVVPEHQARIRMQVSATHTDDDIRRAIEALIGAGRAHGVL